MIGNLFRLMFIFIAVWICPGVVNEAFSQTIALTAEEKLLLKEHPVITLGTERAWEPYVIVRDDGAIEGYDADILNRINQRTGAYFKLVAGGWQDMQDKARRRQIDGLSTGGVHDERKTYLNFSDYYISLKKLVLTPRGNPKRILADQDLAGKTIAIHRGNLVDEKLARNYPNSKILAVDSVEEMIRAVVNGRADATFGNGATLYQANRIGLPYLEIAYELEQSLQLAFGVRNDWPLAISILNKGLRQISQRERIALIDKWFLTSNKPNHFSALVLNESELKYVATHSKVSLNPSLQFPPFLSVDKQKCSGLLADYFDLLSKKTGLEISCGGSEFSPAGVDADISVVARLSQQFRDPNFFSVYENPLVIIAGEAVTYVENLPSLKGKRIAFIEQLVPASFLQSVEKDLILYPVKTHRDMVEAVAKEEVDAAVSGILAATQAIAATGWLNVRIVGDLGVNQQLGFKAEQSPLLPGILSKALNSIRPEEKQALANKWLSVRYEHGTDYQLLIASFVSFVLILMGILTWNRKLAQLNSQIQSYLLLINQNLLLVTLNKEGVIVNCSEAFRDWAGMPTAQLIGMDHAEFFAPDKTEVLDDSRHDAGYMEMLFQPPRGEPRHIEIHPLEGIDDSSGETRYIIHDISEKIQSLKNKHEQHILDQKMAILSDMHDGFGGVVTALSLTADNALRKNALEDKNQALQDIAALAKEGATEMRLMMNALENQDLSWQTLIADLRQIANILLSGNSVQLTFHRPETLPQHILQQEDYFSLYRWFKEAVTNAVKHSGAAQLQLGVSLLNNTVEIRVKDDGSGFLQEPDSSGHGLRSMASRAAELGAELTIDSTCGTEVILKVPLNKG